MLTNQPVRGVLRVQTPLGPRYFRLSFLQRLYIRWIFRHFLTLPVKVLSPWQLRFIDGLCDSRHSVSWLEPDVPVLGTLEQRPPAHGAHASPAKAESVSPLAADQNRP
jgi:hypothetical protein